MKYFWILVLFISIQVRAEDVGNGIDGACTTATITTAKRSYQCTSLTIDNDLVVFSGNNPAGANGAPLVIKVQTDVIFVSGKIIDLSGQDGVNGGSNLPPFVYSGGRGGAGGNTGGNAHYGGNGLDGLGDIDGIGTGGLFVPPDIPAHNSYGGGGGGGSYGVEVTLDPTDGDDGGGNTIASKGSNGSDYGDEANFETSFTGGSGGGAGGGGDQGGTLFSGSSGAGGGGALHIIAGGNINIDGKILVNGGGGGGFALPAPISISGGGGGGSGGAIWLQAAGQITITGTSEIFSKGGIGGENDLAGFGGNGSIGRIRLDDGDGTVSGGTITPVAYNSVFVPTTTPPPGPTPSPAPLSVRQYSSGVSCAKVALDVSSENFAINLILGMGLALGFGLLGKRKVRAQF
jgi:hypothetical protein